VIDSRYTKKTHQFEFLNIYLRKVVTLHQAEVKITNYGLHKSDSTGLYRALALNMTIETFQPKDIILKQGAINNKVFFIVQGIVEIIDEKADYEFYNYEATGKF
jgi:CRP-like cAMP-binding protein